MSARLPAQRPAAALPPTAAAGGTLCGPPELPFGTRLSMTVAAYSLTASRLILVGSGACTSSPDFGGISLDRCRSIPVIW